MFSLLKKITMALVVASLAPFSFALEINQNNYETYIGDVDGDGDGDYYFKQKPWTLILHGDIATPLLLKGTKHFVVYNNAGVLSAPQSFTLADADLTNKINSGALRLANLDSGYFCCVIGVRAKHYINSWRYRIRLLIVNYASNFCFKRFTFSF